jgi:hypothetical protein
MSAKSSILMRPAGMDPMVTSKNTTGFFGFGGLWCQSTEVAVADGGVGPAEMAAPPVDAMEVLQALAPDASRRSAGQGEMSPAILTAELVRWRLLNSRLCAKIRVGCVENKRGTVGPLYLGPHLSDLLLRVGKQATDPTSNKAKKNRERGGHAQRANHPPNPRNPTIPKP